MKRFLLLLLWLCASGLIVAKSNATGITFTLANQQVTGTDPRFYEFDVMAAASTAGTRVGGLLVYINYNTLAFGESISHSGRVTVTKGALIAADGNYREPMTNGNAVARMSIGIQYIGSAESGALLPITPAHLLHVKIEILEPGEQAGISFEQSLMELEQYESNFTPYDPVIASSLDNSVLPVELTSFDALFEGRDVQLSWETASELNNAGFEVERALGSSDRFEKVGYVKGHGTTTEAQRYRYADTDLPFDASQARYRLRQVDYDGKYEHSPVVEVALAAPDRFTLHGNYPNPFNPETTIRYELPGAEQVNLRIFDALGREVALLVDGVQNAGRHEVRFEAHNLPSGIYFYRMEAGAKVEIRRMLLVK